VPQRRRTQYQAAILLGLVVILGVATAVQTNHLTTTLARLG
jgi:hypothetical protein